MAGTGQGQQLANRWRTLLARAGKARAAVSGGAGGLLSIVWGAAARQCASAAARGEKPTDHVDDLFLPGERE